MPHPTAPDAAAPHRIFLVYSHTHWDREWYLPFHEYRLRLTEMAGGLLDLLENDQDFRCFHFDGHSAVIDDHLEMHPEDEERVRAQVQAGRLLMGPWYILPDEFLVSGESLVRNLLLGRRIARRFGEPMPVGYLPDQFGHVGQIPQILRGFGLDSAVIWRGVADPVDGSELWWEAPDGSGVGHRGGEPQLGTGRRHGPRQLARTDLRHQAACRVRGRRIAEGAQRIPLRPAHPAPAGGTVGAPVDQAAQCRLRNAARTLGGAVRRLSGAGTRGGGAFARRGRAAARLGA
ncbi:MAG: hypothetical protein NTZ05_12905 [Chloroflexi bacterium]|nr:hypothetical protein [Chloroflexota bacterium]